MRILVDIRHLAHQSPSGVGVYTTELLRALFEIDHEHEYILFSSGRVKPDLSTLHLTTPNKLLNLRTLLLRHPAINWHVREPVDLIFLPNLNITTLPQDIPTVLTLHDLSFKTYPEFYSLKMRTWHKATRPEELITQSRAIITPSMSTARDAQRLYGVPPEKTHVIPHGVSALFTQKMQAQDHGVRSRLKLPKHFALFVGTIEPRKNLIALVEGVKEYRERTHDDLHLVLAGGWGWKSHDLRRRLWKRDTQGWVRQIGYVDPHDLPALYRSAAVTVWPSIWEGFGLPVLESMASGTPVITSHTSSLPEVAGNAAIYIDPYNSRDIAEALRGLLGSTALQTQLVTRGLERAKNFTWKKAALQTLDVFRKARVE
ncbi:glycosyltransferase family 4 protein [Candidatus Uhrbacteria bacterium]|nr:glycosyltransferase family 4 protein [Candidatus Uhrbacteria bacterium]